MNWGIRTFILSQELCNATPENFFGCPAQILGGAGGGKILAAKMFGEAAKEKSRRDYFFGYGAEEKISVAKSFGGVAKEKSKGDYFFGYIRSP